MDNSFYKMTCDRIMNMDVLALRREIKSLERSQADPFPDDDMAGDIATSNWLSLARERLADLERVDKPAEK